MSSDNDTEAHLTPLQARGAVKTGRMRYVLLISLTAIVVAFAVLYAILV